MKTVNIIRRHAEMVFDFGRSLPLIRAIEKTIRPGDVVVDLGCGLGLLSFAAVHAGAKRVYAIDVDSGALDFARWQAKQLGMEKKICFLNDHSYNVDLVEKADLLIQETIGRLAFDENFLPTLIDAKKRFLKPRGNIIPQEVRLMGVPLDSKRKFIKKPSILAKITSKNAKNAEINIKKTWKMTKKSNFKGILVWPYVIWTKGEITDASPKVPETHWHQTILSPSARHQVTNRMKFSLKISPHPQNPLYNSQIEWQIGPPIL